MSVPLIKYVLPFYYSCIPSECASNLSRFDGIRYGYQPEFEEMKKSIKDESDLFAYITKVRTEGFGINVKRRVMLGNFLSSSKYEDFNERLVHSQKFRRMLIEQYCNVMERNDIDFIICPNTFGETPPKIEDILKPSEESKN